MLPGMELLACPNLAVPKDVMHHVVQVESSYNPYAIGVVGGRLVRQPRSLPEAVSTARMLEQRGYNFSLGLAQVNRYNLAKYGLESYERAFEPCANLQAGSRILAECYTRSRDWGKSFSCYYSGDFKTGFRHGYVQKVYASMRADRPSGTDVTVAPIAVVDRVTRRIAAPAVSEADAETLSAVAYPASLAPMTGRIKSPRALSAAPTSSSAAEPASAASAPGIGLVGITTARGSSAPLRAGPAPPPFAVQPTRLAEAVRTAPARGGGDDAFVF
jgi:type IV secretion system protein VirB1